MENYQGQSSIINICDTHKFIPTVLEVIVFKVTLYQFVRFLRTKRLLIAMYGQIDIKLAAFTDDRV